MDLNYLKELHNFLFGDIYYEEDLQIRKAYQTQDLERVNELFNYLNERAEEITPEQLTTTFESLW